ncbi:hypothetical protein [Geodermatophilus pulveris]|uniref:hypothetical protein n=1 Tax=Geodermatophilus pulveris TaxID=1564159 RepID=UPI00117A252E|nr:hypothetical protein [Geodermatophilus pulveris]
MPEPSPDLTSAPTYFELVEPSLTAADGRRMWRLTEDVRLKIHPNGRIEITDSTRRSSTSGTGPPAGGRRSTWYPGRTRPDD